MREDAHLRRGDRDRFKRRRDQGKVEPKSSTGSINSEAGKNLLILLRDKSPCVSFVSTRNSFFSCTIFLKIFMSKWTWDIGIVSTYRDEVVMLSRNVKMKSSSGAKIGHVCYQPPYRSEFHKLEFFFSWG